MTTQQNTEPKEFTLKFPLEEINLILGGLAELPYKNVAHLFMKIQSSIQSQLMSAEAVKETLPD